MVAKAEQVEVEGDFSTSNRIGKSDFYGEGEGEHSVLSRGDPKGQLHRGGEEDFSRWLNVEQRVCPGQSLSGSDDGQHRHRVQQRDLERIRRIQGTGMQAQTNHVEPQILGTFRHEEGLRNAGVEWATFTEHSVPAGHRRIAAQRPTELGIAGIADGKIAVQQIVRVVPQVHAVVPAVIRQARVQTRSAKIGGTRAAPDAQRQQGAHDEALAARAISQPQSVPDFVGDDREQVDSCVRWAVTGRGAFAA